MDKNALLTVDEMYRADARAAENGVATLDLMEAAGAAVAAEIEARWDRCPVAVLCGPGNNGGDGFVVARLLKERGWPVRVALLGARDRLKGDAAVNAARWDGDVEPMGIPAVEGCRLVVDAIFGAGLSRAVGGEAADVIDVINELGLDVVAVDVPSGVSGDNGAVMGCAPACVLSVTFFRPKPGHFLYPGAELCGDVAVADIGIPDNVLLDIRPQTYVNGPDLWCDRFPRPTWRDNKYARGHVVVAGGDKMTGAARLAARAARRIGAGLVTVACPAGAVATYAAGDPGMLVQGLADSDGFAEFLADSRRNAVLVGPGGGVTDDTADKVVTALKMGKSCVLDADALSVFAGRTEELFAWFRNRDAEKCLLTPHDGEFRRLFAWEGDRLTRARSAASECGAVVLLKGPDTVIAHPDGRAVIDAGAPPTLATAGAGDVLAGLAVGLMGQGIGAFDAACMAAWVHGRAAADFGPGLIAEDLVDGVPFVLERMAGES